MQISFGAFTRIEKVQRTAQHAGPAGDGETRVVSVKCLMSLNDHLLRPGGSICNNIQYFRPITAKSGRYKNSFFVRTAYDLNLLSDNIVNCDSVITFRTLIDKRDLNFLRTPPR